MYIYTYLYIEREIHERSGIEIILYIYRERDMCVVYYTIQYVLYVIAHRSN